jgi:hypothetical protein
VTVRSRFARSVSLARDWARDDALEGYILTPSGREVLGRFVAAVRGDSPARAWSLTGPYGSGKSAFALFAAHLLGGKGATHERAKEALREHDAKLWRKLFQGKVALGEAGGLFPVLVSGTREPLEVAVAAGALQALQRSFSRSPRALVRQLEGIAEAGQGTSRATELVSAFEELVGFVANPEAGYQGVLLVIDELGKFLEYAASHPEEGDVFALQALAEAAARSEKPFLVATVLHQAVDRYTAQISPNRRQEWAKVQGRFEDVAFEEPTEQVLRLLAAAIERRGEANGRLLSQEGKRLAGEAIELGVRLGGVEGEELSELLAACVPLHPTVALVLGPLFKRLAQNERSLFAFLTSGEPFGFQDFLRRTAWGKSGGEVYRLDSLYDYVTTALGGALYSQHRGRYWAEVQSTLERLHDAGPLEVRVAKAVGLVQALGYSAGVPASRLFLRFAFAADGVAEKDVDAAIEALVARSAVVYRRHADSYALWEGSDVNIEARLEEARRAVDPGRTLAAYLSELSPGRSLVARRHSYRTGTLRYFEVAYADQAGLQGLIDKDLEEGDGRVVYCLPLNAEERATMEGVLNGAALNSKATVVTALPKELFDLKEACQELACLGWVAQNTPELAGDATARRELRARVGAAGRAIQEELGRVFAPGGGLRCRWFYKGDEVTLASSRNLNEFLSKVCDEVYSSTPHWRNELVNRRTLSSSAAAARRNLIEAMIEHPAEKALGIEGFPPERSMYDSLLAGPGIHREEEGGWGFYPPKAKRKGDRGTPAVWKAVTEFFQGAEEQPRPAVELFEILRAAPYGLKDGVLPVILAAALIHHDTEVALYDQGTFVPSLTIAVFEGILYAPDHFEVQFCRIAGPRAVVFSKYASMLSGGQGADAQPTLLEVVRPLIKFVRGLPDYAANTQKVGAVAKAVLGVLKAARQPDQMLFTDLPTACGVEPFGTKGSPQQAVVDSFFGTLRAALGELQQAYPRLQAELGHLVIAAFGLTGPLAQARSELTHRAKLVSDLAVDQKLGAFLVRAIESTSDDALWLESLAALLAGKPTRAWGDEDRARFEVNLALNARTFKHFHALAFEMEERGAPILDGDEQALRVAVTLPNRREVERVVRIPAKLKARAGEVADSVRQLLASAEMLDDRELSAAVLARVFRDLLAEDEQG